MADDSPARAAQCELQGAQPAPLIAAERTLEQALLNLLDNAADADATAPRKRYAFAVDWDADAVAASRSSTRSGARRERQAAPWRGLLQHQGRPGSRPLGLGIGLFLSNATIERLGGQVELFNRDDAQGGACTRVTLPLKRLKA
jgi:two-component system sensor histidine kinase RegB